MVAGPRAKFSSVTRAAVVPDLNAERRWRAVLARDRRYDGAFVYAVRSTGIYCRPSCASRKPRRAQVAFFPVPEAAERAGFRACRRCHPGAASPADPHITLVRSVCRLIDARPDVPASLATLSASAATTPHRLLRAFRAVLGVTPRQYRDERRLARFKTQLKERKKVSPALYEAGYGSTSRVYERADAQLGMTAATIARDDDTLRSWAAEITAHLDGRQPHLDLPVDVRATAFQRRVWEALRKIPYGSTRSYSEIARAMGNAKATRAVARACATNPVAIVVPCHRVVRADGDLGGYRWGIERKKELLARETGKATS